MHIVLLYAIKDYHTKMDLARKTRFELFQDVFYNEKCNVSKILATIFSVPTDRTKIPRLFLKPERDPLQENIAREREAK